MNQARFAVTLALTLLAAPFAVEAQQAEKVYQVGLLSIGGDPTTWRFQYKPFIEGMSELNYVEGRNLVIKPAFGDGKAERLGALVAELVSAKVDVIVASGGREVTRAKLMTSTIPIVMWLVPDPVGQGLVASLARPGGNVTGLSGMDAELGGKRLQLLKQVVPGASRVAVLWNATNPYMGLVLRGTEAAARELGVQLQSLQIRAPEDIDRAFETAIKGGANAITVVEDVLIFPHRARIAALAAQSRLPAIYSFRESVEAGGLMSYATSLADLRRHTTIYVDKILRGAKPGDLPIEQPTKFELVINLKTAKTLGLTIPPSVLARADEVIE
jgi:putative ABC transport system substrate-binding protein